MPADRPAPQDDAAEGLRLLIIALVVAIVTHGVMLPFTHGNSYDAYIHMFFGDHYARSWFDPWEPRWYTGFSTTSYPPGSHMMIATLSTILPLRAAFCVVMLLGIILLTLGTYRFALIWVPAHAAGYAALALVLSSSLSETVHLFGQLPTILSLGIFLNGLPWVYRWIVRGGWTSFGAAVILGAATTAAHHVTTLFGAVLFIIPLALQALRAVAEEAIAPAPRPSGSQVLDNLRMIFAQPRPLGQLRPFLRPVGRGLLLAAALIVVMVGTILPYWHWSISDPITQTPIPHGSRESFLDRPDLGLIFFVLPWGASLIALPYAIYKGATTRLWPLGGAVVLCFVLGTGGTTPLPRLILGGAFDILTLDRFTFWATILILPFVGLMVHGLMHGRSGQMIAEVFGHGLRRLALGTLLAAYVAGMVLCAILPTIRPMQPAFIDPGPITAFLERDDHDRWRYLTLGFGDQFAYVSAMTSAQSVDGNYHSARRLPDLTRYAVERLENAKFAGVPGLGSLQQFLVNADRYHLKYVFSNDGFYDPLLIFTGWNRLERLSNGVAIWERPDIAPLPLLQPRRDLPQIYRLIWGILPPLALTLAALVLALAALSAGFAQPHASTRPYRPQTILPGPYFANPARIRRVVLGIGLGCALLGLTAGGLGLRAYLAPPSAEEVLRGYFTDLDLRRFRDAYDKLDPKTKGTFEEARFPWNWRGGLIASYGKLQSITPRLIAAQGNVIDWQVRLDWLSPLDVQHEDITLRMVRREGRWFVLPLPLRPAQAPQRISRNPDVLWNVTGRRQPRIETDLYRDRLDRPQILLGSARLVRHGEAYSVVGRYLNPDAEPAHVTITSQLLDGDGGAMIQTTAGTLSTHRLLPGEVGVFRLDHEGILSLQDKTADQGFDPKLFVAPDLPRPPAGAQVSARALVVAENLYRGIALNGIRLSEAPDGGILISATAVNTGTRIASVTRVLASLSDADGKPIWVEGAYVTSNILPGQSSPFQMHLPPSSAIKVIADVDPALTEINGTGAPRGGDPSLADAAIRAGSIPLQGLGGYGFVRIDLSSMTHEAQF